MIFDTDQSLLAFLLLAHAHKQKCGTIFFLFLPLILPIYLSFCEFIYFIFLSRSLFSLCLSHL